MTEDQRNLSPLASPSASSGPKRTRTRHPGIFRLKASGRYQVTFRAGGQQRSASFDTLRQALQFQTQTRADLSRGNWTDPAGARVRFSEWVELWLETRRVRPTTAERTRSILERHLLPAFGDRPLGSITPREVRLWVAAMEAAGLARATVQKSYALLGQIMAEAVDEDLIARSPCRGIRLDPETAPARRPRALSTAEAARLLESLNGAAVQRTPYAPDPPRRSATPYTLVLTMLGTGLRWGEATGLRRRRVRLLKRPPVLEVAESLHEISGRLSMGPPKTRASERAVPLPALVAQALATHLPPNGDPDDLVFTTTTGTPLSRANFHRRHWQPAVVAAGLEGVRIHDLRHTYASWLADGGLPEVVIAAVLGHKVGPTITAHYTTLLPGAEERILAVLEERLGAAEGGVGVGG